MKLLKSVLFALSFIFTSTLLAEDPASEDIFKLVTRQAWEESLSQKTLIVSSYDQEFIHLCMKDQIARIAQKFFAKEAELIVVKLDPSKLSGKLVKEKNPGGSAEYYHLYNGSIPMDAIINTEIYKP